MWASSSWLIWKIKVMLCGLFLVFVFVVRAGDQEKRSLVLIFDKNLILHSHLNQAMIRRIFLGWQQIWEEKELRVILIIPDDLDLLNQFTQKYLLRTSAQFHNYWRRMVFTGKGFPPKEYRTYNDLISKLSNYPGSIAVAFLSEEEIQHLSSQWEVVPLSSIPH